MRIYDDSLAGINSLAGSLAVSLAGCATVCAVGCAVGCAVACTVGCEAGCSNRTAARRRFCRRPKLSTFAFATSLRKLDPEKPAAQPAVKSGRRSVQGSAGQARSAFGMEKIPSRAREPERELVWARSRLYLSKLPKRKEYDNFFSAILFIIS